jgi:hypothetical protein
MLSTIQMDHALAFAEKYSFRSEASTKQQEHQPWQHDDGYWSSKTLDLGGLSFANPKTRAFNTKKKKPRRGGSLRIGSPGVTTLVSVSKDSGRPYQLTELVHITSVNDIILMPWTSHHRFKIFHSDASTHHLLIAIYWRRSTATISFNQY